MIETDRREIIIDRARGKYIETGITANITEALRLYLETDASPDEQIPLYISSPAIRRIKAILTTIRPTCDACESPLSLSATPRTVEGKTYPSTWLCKACGMEFYSDKTPAEWLKELQDEARKQNLRRPDEPGPIDVPA